MNIIYIGNIGAEGTAMSIHAHNIAELLKRIGHEVEFICSEPGFNRSKIVGYDNYHYVRRYINFPLLRSVEYRLENIFGNKLLSLLKQVNEKNKVHLVILYDYSGERKLIDYCKKNKIPIIADRVDWFENSDLRNTFYNKIYTKYIVDQSTTNLDKELDGVIAISKFLYSHYEGLGVKSIWLPPIFSSLEKNISLHVNSRLEIVYAGSLGGNKDIITPVIEAMMVINKDKIRIKLNLVGIQESQLKEQFNIDTPEKFGITAYGWVPHSKSQDIIQSSDFGILLRNNKRYAKAGFSTKFAECMSFGLPMICTRVGGADTVIEDGVDGILLNDNRVVTVIDKFMEIINMSADEIMKMKINAYNKAYILFNADSYFDNMKHFIENISSKS